MFKVLSHNFLRGFLLIISVYLFFIPPVYAETSDKAERAEPNKSELTALLKEKWEGMKAALIAGNTEAALTYFVEGVKDDHRKIFMEMGKDKINSTFSGMSEFKIISIQGHVAQCEAIRIESSGRFSYPVVFIKDENGFWKILGL